MIDLFQSFGPCIVKNATHRTILAFEDSEAGVGGYNLCLAIFSKGELRDDGSYLFRGHVCFADDDNEISVEVCNPSTSTQIQRILDMLHGEVQLSLGSYDQTHLQWCLDNGFTDGLQDFHDLLAQGIKLMGMIDDGEGRPDFHDPHMAHARVQVASGVLTAFMCGLIG